MVRPHPGQAVTLGANRGERDFVWDNELERHDVAVRRFWLDDLPVTIGEYLDFVSAGGYQNRRVCLAIRAGRGAENTGGAAGNTARHRQHDGGGGQRRSAGRHVQADSRNRAHDTFAHDASSGFYCLAVRQLRLVIARHVCDRGLQCLDLLGCQAVTGRRELGVADFEVVECNLVQFFRQLPERDVAATAYIREYLPHAL